MEKKKKENIGRRKCKIHTHTERDAFLLLLLTYYVCTTRVSSEGESSCLPACIVPSPGRTDGWMERRVKRNSRMMLFDVKFDWQQQEREARERIERDGDGRC